MWISISHVVKVVAVYERLVLDLTRSIMNNTHVRINCRE